MKKILKMILDLSDFRWLEPIKTDPAQRDWSRRFTYHKDQFILQSSSKVSTT